MFNLRVKSPPPKPVSPALAILGLKLFKSEIEEPGEKKRSRLYNYISYKKE